MNMNAYKNIGGISHGLFNSMLALGVEKRTYATEVVMTVQEDGL
jgi:hypothetical protein